MAGIVGTITNLSDFCKTGRMEKQDKQMAL